MLGLSKEQSLELRRLQLEYNKRMSKHLEILDAQMNVQWGGNLRYITSDGRNVNIAEELNKLENNVP